jgi:hypothetical protein
MAVKLHVPAELAGAFTPSAPGLVRSDLGGDPETYFVLCGQAFTNPLWLTRDLGFGCMGALKGTQETAHAWVQPMPSGWDAAAVCAAVPAGRSFYNPTTVGDADAGTALTATADPSWLQGTDVGTWRADLSPCGGVLNTEITLAQP